MPGQAAPGVIAWAGPWMADHYGGTIIPGRHSTRHGARLSHAGAFKQIGNRSSPVPTGGGEHWVIIATLIETRKLNGLEPHLRKQRDQRDYDAYGVMLLRLSALARPISTNL
jgi:hypothetical protein